MFGMAQSTFFSSIELEVIRESWILDCLIIRPRDDVPSIARISNL